MSFLSAVLDFVAPVVVNVSAFLAARALTYAVTQIKPSLTDGQQELLRTHFRTILDSFFNNQAEPGQQINIRQHIRGLIAIICNDVSEQEQEALYHQLVIILEAFDMHESLVEEAPVVTYDEVDFSDVDIDDPNLDILIEIHKITAANATPIPRSVRSALVAELSRRPSPSCSITLEDVLDEQGHICPDVVALVQKVSVSDDQNADSQHTTRSPVERSKFHVFLYKKAALDQWFGVGGAVNPLTRERVHVSSQLFTLSQ